MDKEKSKIDTCGGVAMVGVGCWKQLVPGPNCKGNNNKNDCRNYFQKIAL